jgi:hypothetical protein
MIYLSLLGGGTVLVYFFYAIWEFGLFMRVMDDPVKGKLASVLAGYVTASLLSMFAGAGWQAFLYYVMGAVIVGTFAYSRGVKLREQPEADPVLTETFK